MVILGSRRRGAVLMGRAMEVTIMDLRRSIGQRVKW